MDMELARFNMVEQQVRPWEVLNNDVLRLLREVPREKFVPAQHLELAFVDTEIPLGHGACMLPPKIDGRVLQALNIQPHETVLEIGTGSGFFTALLARSAKEVLSVEIVPELKAFAERNLAQAGITNVVLEEGDAARGWSVGGPFDVIVLTGSTPLLPEAFQQRLTVGGRLFAFVGAAPAMEAHLVTRVSESEFRAVDLFETCVPALQNALTPQRFVF